jgi:hypothetical protein
MLKDGGRQPGNREERSLSASTVIARWQGNGEPCKSRGLRTVLWAAGGEIPPADPAAQNPKPDLCTKAEYGLSGAATSPTNAGAWLRASLAAPCHSRYLTRSTAQGDHFHLRLMP